MSLERDEAYLEGYEERGLVPWMQRNPWLLVRLFMVMVFTFGASTTAANFSYGLEGEPTRIDIAELRESRLPAGYSSATTCRLPGHRTSARTRRA